MRDDEIHVWLARPAQLAGAALIDAARDLLDDRERARLEALHFDRDKDLYLLAHALVRTALSRYAARAPAAWRFAIGPRGKPEIADPPTGPRLRFSLSHTHGLVAVAVAADADVGLDVEDLERVRDPLALARRFFAPGEAALLARLPEAELRPHFFALWTLKEAYVKGRGLGFALPLSRCAFALEGELPRLLPDAALEDDPLDWQLARRRIAPRHTLAIALRRGGAPDRQVWIREADWLAEAIFSATDPAQPDTSGS